MRKRATSFFFFVFLVICSTRVEGAIYKWVDENGNIFFVDERAKVPKEYWGKIEEIIPPRGATHRTRESVSPKLRSSVLHEPKTDAQGKEKKWWQNLARQWEKKKKDAEARIEALKVEQRQLQFHPMPEKTRLKEESRIQKQIQASIMRRDVAIRMLIEGLPDEAKKAGAPIEWLATHK